MRKSSALMRHYIEAVVLPAVIRAILFVGGVTLLATFVGALVVGPADAQMLCGDHEKVVARLDKNFAERRVNMGLTFSGGVLEVYAAEETGTWTILLTMPGRPTCLVAAGENWEHFTAHDRLKGDPS